MSDGREIYGCEHGRPPGVPCEWCNGQPTALKKPSDHIEIDITLGDKTVRAVLRWQDLNPSADPKILINRIGVMLTGIFRDYIGPRSVAEADSRRYWMEFETYIMNHPRFAHELMDWRSKRG